MIDLHLHLDGSLEPEDIIKLAKISDVKLPETDIEKLRELLTVKKDCTSLPEYLEKFALPLQVLQTEETIEESVYLLVTRLSNQGLCYAEIRFAPQLHTNKDCTQEQVVLAAVTGLNRGIKDSSMNAQLILCCMRGEGNHAMNLQTVEVAKKFLGKGVCALDLAGNEFAYPTDSFSDIFELAREHEIPLTIHAGEARDSKSVSQAIDCGAMRIGHGVHSVDDERVLARLKDKKIPLETCFTSNLQTKAVANIQNYPIRKLIDSGVIVTVNTDNMTVSGTTLKNEYKLLSKNFSMDNELLRAVAINAIQSAFVSEDEKSRLTKRVNADFYEWILN